MIVGYKSKTDQVHSGLIIKLRLYASLKILIDGIKLSPEPMDAANNILVGPVQSGILILQQLAILDMPGLLILDSQVQLVLAVLVVEGGDVVLHLFIELLEEVGLFVYLLGEELFVFYCYQVVLD